MTTTDKNLEVAIENWMEEALLKMGAPELVGRIAWKFNPRLTRNIALARFYPRILGWDLVRMLEFSNKNMQRMSAQDQMETVYHEVAHAVDGWQGTFNRRNYHSPTWEALMVRAGVPPTRYHYFEDEVG